MIRLALYQPDIPQNMGTLMRLGACLSVPLDVIGPTGFDFSDRALKRAGMDYLDKTEIERHVSFSKFLDADQRRKGRLILTTTRSNLTYTDFEYRNGDTIMLGRESAGVPDDVHVQVDASITIPMAEGTRSLNIAVAGAMIVGEALRQTKGFISQ